MSNSLRTIKLFGRPFGVTGLAETATQFEQVAAECDSAAHEVAAMQLRWAAKRINELEGALANIGFHAKVCDRPS